jgi:hypothetical protein
VTDDIRELRQQIEDLKASAALSEKRFQKLEGRNGGRNISGAVAVLGAIVALASATVGAYFQGRSPVTVEKIRFEAPLILDALKSETQDEAAKRLDFLVKAKLIDGRDGAIERLVKEPADLPIRTRATRLRDAEAEIGCPKGMVFDAGTLQCVQGPGAK